MGTKKAEEEKTFEFWFKELEKVLSKKESEYKKDDIFKGLATIYNNLAKSYHEDLHEYYRRELSLSMSPVEVDDCESFMPKGQKGGVKNLNSESFAYCIEQIENATDVAKYMNRMKELYEALHRHESTSKRKSKCSTVAKSIQTH